MCRADARKRLSLLRLVGVILQREKKNHKGQEGVAHEDAEAIDNHKEQQKDEVDSSQVNVVDVQKVQQVLEATRIYTWPGPQNEGGYWLARPAERDANGSRAGPVQNTKAQGNELLPEGGGNKAL